MIELELLASNARIAVTALPSRECSGTGAPMTMGDRFINPLGFQVTRYRRDAETVAGSAAPSDMSAAPAK